MRGPWLASLSTVLILGAGSLAGDCHASQSAKPDGNTVKAVKEKQEKVKPDKDKTDKPDQSDAAAAKEDGAAWLADISKAAIPRKPAIGRLHGEPFRIEGAVLQGGVLSLRQGSDFFADLEFKLFLFVDGPGRLENQGLDILDEENPPTKTVPHVYMSWKPDPKSLPKTKTWTGDYVIRLHFGQVKNGRLPGEIYLCLPDLKQSFVAGTFNAVLK